ncbi:unnamed protein product [Cyclocybe aegerita]|uniref:Uncharacterized protein n=1 Tax=Cyclocybe aegerita TaxID=1973307 RepID=A0A8S0W2T9_CYCAE|nr:unnamed protein product [Cyclocybe aegerita]
MESPARIPFIQYFVGVGIPYALFSVLEGHRKNQTRILSYPVIWLLLTQFVSYGATYPVYCLLFVMTGGVTKTHKHDASSSSRAQAESFGFGIFMGGVIPSCAMFIVDEPFMTYIWQCYPAFIALAQAAYLRFRESANSRSGYSTIRALHILVFLTAASSHILILCPYKGHTKDLIKYFVPSTTPPSSSTSIDFAVLHFLKWGFVLGYTAFALAMFWYVETVQEFIAVVASCNTLTWDRCGSVGCLYVARRCFVGYAPRSSPVECSRFLDYISTFTPQCAPLPELLMQMLILYV